MTKIYDQHDAAFKQVSAYVIVKDNERVATIAFKFPKDGAGRLWCYFHWIGDEMVRGYTGGYGYDKTSAAAQNAISAGAKGDKFKRNNQVFGKGADDWTDLMRAFSKDIGGANWDNVIRDAGFQVLKAV